MGTKINEHYRVKVNCKGVKKRARKVDNHFFFVGDFPLTVRDDETARKDIEQKALEVLATNMREYHQATVSAWYEYEKENLPGMVTTEPFSELNFDMRLGARSL